MYVKDRFMPENMYQVQDNADRTAPTRQHELGHTDFAEISISSCGDR